MWDDICCSPAVLIEGHDEALVLDAGNRGVVAVLAGKNLFSAILLLPPDVRVFRPVEPEKRHHHLACKLSISHMSKEDERRRGGRRGDDEWLVAPHRRPDFMMKKTMMKSSSWFSFADKSVPSD